VDPDININLVPSGYNNKKGPDNTPNAK